MTTRKKSRQPKKAPGRGGGKLPPRPDPFPGIRDPIIPSDEPIIPPPHTEPDSRHRPGQA